MGHARHRSALAVFANGQLGRERYGDSRLSGRHDRDTHLRQTTCELLSFCPPCSWRWCSFPPRPGGPTRRRRLRATGALASLLPRSTRPPCSGWRRVRIKWVLLGFHGTAGVRVRPTGVALRHKSLDTRQLRGGKQMIGSSGTKQVRGCELLLEFAQIEFAWNRGKLVNDYVRTRSSHGGRHGGRI